MMLLLIGYRNRRADRSAEQAALAPSAILFESCRIEAGLSRTIQPAAADPDLDASMIADRQHLVGAGLRLIVGPAADREGRRDPVCGVEKETVILQHGLHDTARETPVRFVADKRGGPNSAPAVARSLS